MSSKVTINIAIAVLVILIIYFGYALFSAEPETDIDPTMVAEGYLDGTGNVPSVATQQFIGVLASLSGVTLSGDIFEDEIFQEKLQDFSKPLPFREFGRTNPFAPVGASDARAVTRSTTTVSGFTTVEPLSSQTGSNNPPPPTSIPINEFSGQ